MADGGTGRTGASTELPASLRGGGFGLGTAAGAGGFGAATGLGASDGGFGGAADGAAALAAGAGGLAAGALVAAAPAGSFVPALAAGDRAGALARCGGAFADAGRLTAGAGVLGAGLLAVAALGTGRLATAALAGALVEALRRAVAGEAFAAARAAPVAGRAGRLAVGLTVAFGFGRGAGTRRVAVACLAGAAFLGLAAERAGLLTALGAVVRFPAPLAGVDAFIPAISPSKTGRERGEPSTRPRAPPEDLEPAIPWAAGPEPA